MRELLLKTRPYMKVRQCKNHRCAWGKGYEMDRAAEISKEGRVCECQGAPHLKHLLIMPVKRLQRMFPFK